MRGAYHKSGFRVNVTDVGMDSAIVGPSELRRIKKESVHLTPIERKKKVEQDDLIRRKNRDDIENKRQAVYNAEIEKNERKQAKKTMKNMEKRRQVMENTMAEKNEELDEVKTMNSNMMEARVLAIRDLQLEYKKEQMKREKEEDDRLNRMLEEGRQRAVKIYREREEMLQNQRKKGKKMLEAQIQEKEQQKRIDSARREEEKKLMQEANKRALEESQQVEIQRKKRQQEFMEDCVRANEASRRRKHQERQRELDEDRMMVEYQKEQSRKQEEYEQKVRKQKALKEKEIDMIRKQQQREIDERAAYDELMARRIQNEKERKDRERELEETKKRINDKKMLAEEYEKMRKFQTQRAIEMAKIEKKQWESDMAVIRAARAKEKAERQRRLENDEKYRNELREVIDNREEQKRMKVLYDLDEQKTIQEEKDDYMAKLERIRQMKIDQLRREGVPEKYIQPLMNQKIVIK
ncbi:Cilia- and flagella-associated protein 45 [Tritrichomonas musculus]|uniref:Cilia- and flagella-associated protein 45 n=1 Tax=Tritrichomonas musculus TaxID=1915356 RepID=A0ABR2L176_9EUKA